ncbi:MAG: YidB family protein [Xanthobacteraceae bacterium]
MGLMDVLNGMQNGPHGAPNPGSSPSGKGMSPITMAVLGLLAYKAIKSFTAAPSATPAAPGANKPAPSGQTANAGSNIGDILKNGLDGLLGAGTAGTVLSSGLNDLLKQFQQAGQGNAANSWVGNGPNKSISPDDLAKVLDSDQIKTLMAHAGLSRDEVLNALSQHLPGLVNEMTPNGRPPTGQEVSQMFQ